MWLLACTAQDSAKPEKSLVDSGSLESIPPLETSLPKTLDAPAKILLDCPGEIPLDGKTDCSLQIFWPDEEPVFVGPAGAGIHGRSSAGFPKLQYAIELRDEAGADFKVDLFGMGAAADWLLNGMYIDRALFRNKLAYDLFREMGHPAPESVYSELWLNGEYWGVYLLNERIERGDERVEMPGDDGMGSSFLVKADETGLVSSVQYASWAILYPKEADQTPAVTSGVRTRLGAMEAKINSADPALWEDLQLQSFLDFVLVEEFFKNNDAYYLSHHLYTDKDSLLQFLPWDLDLTLGQPYYNENWRTDTWIAYRPALIANPVGISEVRPQLAERWRELRAGILEESAVLARMEQYHNFLGGAINRNFRRWDITQIQFAGDQLYPVGSHEEEYALVQEWVKARLLWMDTAIVSY
jgi:hypothetical protein